MVIRDYETKNLEGCRVGLIVKSLRRRVYLLWRHDRDIAFASM